ncbi:methyl-accepting chemotaxis protein [Alkalihalophilus pseudofirmus OF4]|uniref:Methyl-accepting chemotaxis protein n=1 Tax=Alkalihalophilus pseudofirmus (strain ATCC BAA-2126 / JCM 17055 / OF4) TaxID=398511 RepID=D3FZJ3_ALKPO|nr:methyl-accepting chemotaxis protein [Alkalihalophilus pseudofirmus]ADC49235.1 methyl-accepting chemotaxis protein [Alkalihalophilus pseudofirmus OF4]
MSRLLKLLKTLKMKLIISFTLILIIPSVVIGMLAYNAAKGAVEEEIISAGKQDVNLLNSIITNTIEPKINDMNVFSESVTSDLYDGTESPELREKFAQYAALHPEATSIFVGTEEDGLFIQEPAVAMDPDYDPRERDWYIDAMSNTSDVVISEPYIAAGTDDMVITVSKALQDGSGVVAVSVDLTHLQELANSVQIGNQGYAILLDDNQMYIAHPFEEGGTQATQAYYKNLYTQEIGEFPYELNGDSKHMVFVTNDMTGWKVAGNMYEEEVDEAAFPIFLTTIGVIAMALVVGGVSVYFVILSIIKPIRKLTDSAVTVSKGDLTEEITIHSNDEIGQLASAFKGMQMSLKELINEVDSKTDLVAASAEELTASSEETSAATSQVASSIQTVASSAESQTNGIEKNSQSIEELTVGVGRIAESSMSVAELTQQATLQAEEGNEAIQNTIKQMNSIEASVTESNTMIRSLFTRSKEITSILDVITGIAEQTNLLALNAAIEAARAGEHGKGFAVVAGEVRKLAEQSQDSAKQIFELIQGIQKDTESSVEVMSKVTHNVKDGMTISHDAMEKFAEILSSMRSITPQMQEVSATAEQMSAGIQEVNATTSELAGIANNNAATSEEVAATTEEQLAAMEEVASSAKSLSEMAEELKMLLSKFKV